MKLMELARMALPVIAALASHSASAQFTLVSQTGQLEARPGAVLILPEGNPAIFHQSSSDPECMPPRCEETFYHEVHAYTSFEPGRLMVGTGIYASSEPVDMVNKGEVSITFDLAQQTDVLLTVSHDFSGNGKDLAPMSNSYFFARQLGDGSFESMALPTLSNEFERAEQQLNITLQAGRYVATSRIAFNSSLSLSAGGGFVVEGGAIQITQVPEPGTFALGCLGAVGLMASARKRAARAKGHWPKPTGSAKP